MTVRHYSDQETGAYVGAFVDGAVPPAGAVERPIPPHGKAMWTGGAWVEPEPEPPVLSAARFAWLLAYTGLDDVWEALETALKQADRAAFATLKAQRAKREFHLSVTLAMVEQFRPQAEAAAPDVDLSEAAIRDAWAKAAEAAI